MIGGPTTLLSKNEDEAVERRSEIQSCHFQAAGSVSDEQKTVMDAAGFHEGTLRREDGLI